jgi:hypothetical protein
MLSFFSFRLNKVETYNNVLAILTQLRSMTPVKKYIRTSSASIKTFFSSSFLFYIVSAMDASLINTIQEEKTENLETYTLI